ncbi:hypothetical protein ACSYAD_30040 [Acaryochloris marina NIES-2412]|uniref:hypothetical protein n=1 Tax=Acaryochloris marina TaxID=155978 RepID=UPI0040595689
MQQLAELQTDSLWPYPQIEQNLTREQQESGYCAPWIEIGTDEYWWFLECLPPIYQDSKGYVNPELYSHTPEGKPLYLGVIETNNQYFAKLVTLAEYIELDISQASLQPRAIPVA